MKKKYIILFLIVFLLPLKIFAAGGFDVSSSSISMYLGETKTISITSNNSVGKLNISSSNGGVASVNTDNVFIQTPGSGQNITITAGSIGTATVSVVASNEYATMDEEILAGVTKTIIVNVISKPNIIDNNTNNTMPNNNSTNKSVNNNNTNKSVVDTRSTNANLKEITIEGYELEKVDENNYKLNVSNNITNVNVLATPEDEKSQILGIGNHELNIGDNPIELVIISESGIQNKINVIITRKDGYYLDDISNVLSDNKINDINITINSNSKLSINALEKIKKAKKSSSLIVMMIIKY